MRTILLIHILAGGAGLLSGYVALSVTKGATLHRRSGMLFVCVMLTMAITGMLISAVEGVAPEINVPSALLVFYLVITSLTTVRTPAPGLRWADRAAMLMALAIAIGCFALGFRAIANGSREAGMAYPLFMFGLVALLAEPRRFADDAVRWPSRPPAPRQALVAHVCRALHCVNRVFPRAKPRA